METMKPDDNVTQFSASPSGTRICETEVNGLKVQVQPRGPEENDRALETARSLALVGNAAMGVDTTQVNAERLLNLELRGALIQTRKDKDVQEQRVVNALTLLTRWTGSCDSDDHKQWLLDQLARALTGTALEDDVAGEPTAEYRSFVAAFEDGADGPKSYAWETGVAP